MFSPSEHFYAIWRTRFVATSALRDENGLPSERLLQAVWQHQRLRRDQLKTTGGKHVRIFHPGFVSVEGGPDFGNSVLQIGDNPPRSGDVEIDLRSSGWRAHGHDRNPGFQNVILHVVWESDGTPDSDPAKTNRPPTLVLRNFLDAPLAELSLSLESEPLRSLPENLRGKCCSPLRELDEIQLAGLLRAAARVRFEAKAGQFRARARHAGWEQVLWENLFRALGYKHNVWPMQHLAETKSRWERGANSAFELQARLLGVSGLLPDELTRAQKSTDSYLRRAWDCWWRDRDEFADCVLPRAAWKFHGLRPANHPQRRLALAAHWLADEKFTAKIESWCAAELPDKKLAGSLREILEVERDEFWSWHWTFRSTRMKKPQPLLGDARVTDLAVNVILPWLWVRAVEGKNEKLRRVIGQRYFAWPAAEDNSVLKLARQRLLGVGKTRALRTAAAQQGLMQIVRDFCEHSNAVCENCRFPELVREWNAPKV
ncbi:MAG: DUF2851 family protein [Verrucomicrobiales bacterium]|nr:DUF2851 family protein [Verrucomicrobiales bacterium]